MLSRIDARRTGFILPIVAGLSFLIGIVLFGLSQQQRHETRWTMRLYEEQRAQLLADAGLARAMARFVAKPFAESWYASPPSGDGLPALKHSGLLDASSQGKDEDGKGGPPKPAEQLDPDGTYTVLAEDRYEGEYQGWSATSSSRLAWTDLFASGEVAGMRGVTRVMVLARMVITPTLDYFAPSATAPETIKKRVRYRVFAEPDAGDRTYTSPGADSQLARDRIHEEIAVAHQNFLRNRDAFRDLHRNVDAAWNAARGKALFNGSEAEALFAGIAPPKASTLASTDGEARNAWVDAALARFHVADGQPQGALTRFLIDPADLITAQQELIADNLLKVFHSSTLTPMPERLSPTSSNPVSSPAEFLLIQESQERLPLDAGTWSRDVSGWSRKEPSATVPAGHFWPYPDPAPGTYSTTDVAKSYVDQVFIDRFATSSPPTVDEMRAEVLRANALGATPQLDPDLYVSSPDPADVTYPVQLRWEVPRAAGGPLTYQMAVLGVMNHYLKYIEGPAVFAPDAPGTDIAPTRPAPMMPPGSAAPPREVPDPVPPDPGGGGGGPGGPPPPPPPPENVKGKKIGRS